MPYANDSSSASLSLIFIYIVFADTSITWAQGHTID